MKLNLKQMRLLYDAMEVILDNEVGEADLTFAYDRITIQLAKDFDLVLFKWLRSEMENTGWESDLNRRMFWYITGTPTRS